MNKALLIFRRTVEILYGGLVLCYFLDVWHLLPWQIHSVLHIQFVPTLMAGAVGVLAVEIAVTLLVGRIYCSTVCPLGILQDVVIRVKTWWLRGAKKRKSLRLKYSRPLNVLRYAVLILCIPVFWGFVPLRLLDPYSIFGRAAVALLRPVVVEGNNVMANVMEGMGNYSVYPIGGQAFSTIMVIVAAVTLLVVLVMAIWKERLWCNTVCPVGAFLGIFSRFSLFKITISKDTCNGCGLCEGACKAHCIDSKEKTIDNSRCVVCFNCLNKCGRTAVALSSNKAEAVGRKAEKEVAVVTMDPSRRDFIKKTALLTAGTLAGSSVLKMVRAQDSLADGVTNGDGFGAVDDPVGYRTLHAMPPGAVNRRDFQRKCTACGLCVSKCPTQVLQPALMENGWIGVMQPYMRFRVESFCTYECNECLKVCPNGALRPLGMEEKKLTRVGEVKLNITKCIVYLNDQDCGACAEHCPTAAVKMVPYKNGLTIPELDPEYCIGCGGCESICPVAPDAIYVQGLDLQERASAPTDDKREHVEVDDFGF